LAGDGSSWRGGLGGSGNYGWPGGSGAGRSAAADRDQAENQKNGDCKRVEAFHGSGLVEIAYYVELLIGIGGYFTILGRGLRLKRDDFLYNKSHD
jgi:hypothetical protein